MRHAVETSEQEASSIEAAADRYVNNVYAKKYTVTKPNHIRHKITTQGISCYLFSHLLVPKFY